MKLYKKMIYPPTNQLAPSKWQFGDSENVVEPTLSNVSSGRYNPHDCIDKLKSIKDYGKANPAFQEEA